MWDILIHLAYWLALVFFGCQALFLIGLVSWTVWTDAIKPRLISAAEINSVADEIIAAYPDPEAEAVARHQRAWYRSDGAAQIYWHRVRKAVRRRLQQG